MFAPENEEADAVAGSLAGPAAESEDSLLIESVAYKDSHGVTHPALAKGTAVQITFINILATQFTAGALSDTVASYAESYGFCPLVSSGPEKGQDGQAILKTSSLSAIFGVKPVLNDTLILTGWVGGTITLHPYITSECVASVTAGSSASVAFSGHFNTSLTTIVGTAPGVTVKSASGAVY